MDYFAIGKSLERHGHQINRKRFIEIATLGMETVESFFPFFSGQQMQLVADEFKQPFHLSNLHRVE